MDADTSDVGRKRPRITANSATIESLDQLNVLTDNFVSFVDQFFRQKSDRADSNGSKGSKRNNHVLNETEAATSIQKLKKGDPTQITNRRPLTITHTAYKIFTAVSDRATEWSFKNGRLSWEQKGFLPYEECYEHNFVLHEAIHLTKSRRRNPVVPWLDLANAFPPVLQGTIRHALNVLGMPAETGDLILNMLSGYSISVKTKQGCTDNLAMDVGVKQGCPLSPIAFNLIFELVIRGLKKLKVGFPCLKSSYGRSPRVRG